MSVFSKVRAVRPGKSVHNLSYDVKMTADMGVLYPVMFKECVAGDTFKIGNEIVIRFQPLNAPVMAEINAFVHYFFVPTRLLMENQQDWIDFITGGVDGEASVALPRWTGSTGYNAKNTLWDYFGLPVGVDPKLAPLSFPKRAYNLIWNEYYMDESLQTPVDIDNDMLLRRSWKKDYFTSALRWQQRGVAPALPVTGFSEFDFSGMPVNFSNGNGVYPVVHGTGLNAGRVLSNNGSAAVNVINASGSTFNVPANSTVTSGTVMINDLSDKYLTEHNTLKTATFDVSDLRLAFQIQKWMERNMRSGVRYTEFLRAHFGLSPRDEVLQRPQYIGGSKSPVIISEVLQTSSTDSTSPQGNLAGHGITADRTYCATYHVKEFGYIIGILSVMPKATYQQGVDKALLRETRYDWYFPEFCTLSENAILNEEIYADGSDDDTKIFGYQGRYNEMRSSHSLCVGDMRDTLDYWHLGRKFQSRPNLNSTFIECVPSKRIFAVQDEPSMVINFGNRIKAIRPIPAMAEPGLIDHH